MPRYGRPKSIRWRVTLRGELLGHVSADNWPAACERAVRRWRISRADQEELVVEKEARPADVSAFPQKRVGVQYRAARNGEER
jgi:hypothetical protein